MFASQTEGELKVTQILKEKFPGATAIKVTDISGKVFLSFFHRDFALGKGKGAGQSTLTISGFSIRVTFGQMEFSLYQLMAWRWGRESVRGKLCVGIRPGWEDLWLLAWPGSDEVPLSHPGAQVHSL